MIIDGGGSLFTTCLHNFPHNLFTMRDCDNLFTQFSTQFVCDEGLRQLVYTIFHTICLRWGIATTCLHNFPHNLFTMRDCDNLFTQFSTQFVYDEGLRQLVYTIFHTICLRWGIATTCLHNFPHNLFTMRDCDNLFTQFSTQFVYDEGLRQLVYTIFHTICLRWGIATTCLHNFPHNLFTMRDCDNLFTQFSTQFVYDEGLRQLVYTIFHTICLRWGIATTCLHNFPHNLFTMRDCDNLFTQFSTQFVYDEGLRQLVYTIFHTICLRWGIATTCLHNFPHNLFTMRDCDNLFTQFSTQFVYDEGLRQLVYTICLRWGIATTCLHNSPHNLFTMRDCDNLFTQFSTQFVYDEGLRQLVYTIFHTICLRWGIATTCLHNFPHNLFTMRDCDNLFTQFSTQFVYDEGLRQLVYTIFHTICLRWGIATTCLHNFPHNLFTMRDCDNLFTQFSTQFVYDEGLRQLVYTICLRWGIATTCLHNSPHNLFTMRDCDNLFTQFSTQFVYDEGLRQLVYTIFHTICLRWGIATTCLHNFPHNLFTMRDCDNLFTQFSTQFVYDEGLRQLVYTIFHTICLRWGIATTCLHNFPHNLFTMRDCDNLFTQFSTQFVYDEGLRQLVYTIFHTICLRWGIATTCLHNFPHNLFTMRDCDNLFTQFSTQFVYDEGLRQLVYTIFHTICLRWGIATTCLHNFPHNLFTMRDCDNLFTQFSTQFVYDEGLRQLVYTIFHTICLRWGIATTCLHNFPHNLFTMRDCDNLFTQFSTQFVYDEGLWQLVYTIFHTICLRWGIATTCSHNFPHNLFTMRDCDNLFTQFSTQFVYDEGLRQLVYTIFHTICLRWGIATTCLHNFPTFYKIKLYWHPTFVRKIRAHELFVRFFFFVLHVLLNSTIGQR